jgi:Tol biopolymer transport system component
MRIRIHINMREDYVLRLARKSIILILLLSLVNCSTPAQPLDDNFSTTNSEVNTPATSSSETQLPVSTPTSWPIHNGNGSSLLTFYSERDGNAEIYTMQPDGSDQRRLTFNQFEDSTPIWSPDGSQIAFISDRDDPRAGECFPDCLFQLYVINPDGSGEHKLAVTEITTHHPDWHPDGTKISFDTEFNFEGDIYTINADGNGLQILIQDGFWGDWSPDGAQIAFASNRDGNVEIYIANADGSNQHRLTENQRMDSFPTWSPDGARIAFMRGDLHERQIFVMNADGSGDQQLTTQGRVNEDPAWSLDGSQIVFQSNRDGNYEIYTLNVDEFLQSGDLDLQRLTNTSAGDYWPSWGLATNQKSQPIFSLEKGTQEFNSRQTFQIALGDLDGDGDLDAVFANPQKNASEVWLNDGYGTFIDSGQKLTQYGHGVGLADFDSDGDLDAFISCHNSVVPSKIYVNDGDGNLQDTGQDLGDRSVSAVEVNLLDLNGDGYMDVHVTYYDPSGLPDKIYLNDGTGNFSDSSISLDEETIAWGDLDGDGDIDYFGKRWKTGYVVQRNDGSGHFSEGWQLADSQTTVGGVALADFDGDGDLDALVTNGFRDTGSHPSRLFLNDGSGQFVDSGLNLNETMGAELAVGDLDNDGDLDVFVTNMDRPNQVWLNDGGEFIDSGLRLGKATDLSGKPSLGDLDGDGDLDVFVGNFEGGAEIWFNTTPWP